MPDPFSANTRTPRGVGMDTTAGSGAVGSGRRPNTTDGASPLLPLISPQNNVPFASVSLPVPAGALAESVGYFGLQMVTGRASGIINFIGYNLRAWSLLTAGPVIPAWGSASQDAAIGNNTGTGAGIIIAHSDALPFRPVLNQWVEGPALFPWLRPDIPDTTYQGGTDRQMVGHPFAMGDLVTTPQSYEITPRDTPLGWDVNRSQALWVLVGISKVDLNNNLGAGSTIYAMTNGRLIFADEARNNPQGG